MKGWLFPCNLYSKYGTFYFLSGGLPNIFAWYATYVYWILCSFMSYVTNSLRDKMVYASIIILFVRILRNFNSITTFYDTLKAGIKQHVP